MLNIWYNIVVKPNVVIQNFIKGVFTMMNHAELHGKEVSPSMLKAMQNLLAYHSGSHKLLAMTATILGNDVASAYISVEMLFAGHECSPVYIGTPITGSHFDGGVNKSFVEILDENEQRAIKLHFRRLASEVSFDGDGKSLEECLPASNAS